MAAVLKPDQWIKLIDRISAIDNPVQVREQPSKFSVAVTKRASERPLREWRGFKLLLRRCAGRRRSLRRAGGIGTGGWVGGVRRSQQVDSERPTFGTTGRHQRRAREAGDGAASEHWHSSTSTSGGGRAGGVQR